MLSDLACRRAKPAAKDYKLADGNGLYLFVMTTGSKSWRWKFRIAGKEKRLVFGSYPDVSLAEARELREAAARSLRQGNDPAIEKRQRKAVQAIAADNTFESIALAWHALQVPVWSKRYASIVLSSLKKDVFPRIGTMPIGAVTTPLVLEVLRPIEARGAIETAHRVRQRISDVFALAIGRGIADADPAQVAAKGLAKVTKGRFPAVRTVAMARAVLLDTELQPAHPLTKLASRLLALTAVRSGVVRMAEAAEFEDLDGKAPLWRIPPAKMKLALERKEDPAFEFLVPLPHQAVATIRAAIALSGNARLIFRSVRHPRKPISDSTISKGYRDAGYSGIHVPHGWRSTFSTVMNERAKEAGRDHDHAVIDLMLAHQPKGVEAAYNRAAYMPRRRAIAQEWADLIMEGQQAPEQLLQGLRQRH
ncbi:tyrosine-type recombinase/integrase [soil metagenome]